jgi:polyisoprenoid-binding protein YceI
LKITGLACLVLLGSATVQADCWKTQPGNGVLQFTASAAGAPTRGEFNTYTGALCLPGPDAVASASVEIETGSIDMGLPEFNAELRGALFFDVVRWPRARFEASDIESMAPDHYRVQGNLTIRDITRTVATEFEARRVADGLHVTAEFSINRLDFDLGLGEWQDTAWVGNPVTIRIDSTLIESSPPYSASSSQTGQHH